MICFLFHIHAYWLLAIPPFVSGSVLFMHMVWKLLAFPLPTNQIAIKKLFDIRQGSLEVLYVSSNVILVSKVILKPNFESIFMHLGQLIVKT